MTANENVEGPPRKARLKYWLLNIPPEVRYRAWVIREMESPWWGIRSMLPNVLGYLAGVALAAVWLGWSLRWFLVGSIVGWLIFVLLAASIPPFRGWVKRRNLSAYERRWARREVAKPSR